MSQIQKKTRKDRFIEGLKAYDLTYEEIKASGWKYAGGDWGSHLNYYLTSRNGMCVWRSNPKEWIYL